MADRSLVKQLIAAWLAAAPILLAQPSRFGLPACQGPSSEFADREYFVLCHDSSLRVPSWTAYEVLPGRRGGNAKRPRRFRADAALSGPAGRDADYRHSGYSRGHMVPAEDMAFSGAAIRATFVLSNAAPQLPSVNQGIWRRVENAVRASVAESDAAYVLTGPVFSSTTADFAGEVAVPTHFFKVWLVIEGRAKRIHAVIVPNAPARPDSLETFSVTVDEVERRTRLDFFAALEDEEERRLESRLQTLPARRR